MRGPGSASNRNAVCVSAADTLPADIACSTCGVGSSCATLSPGSSSEGFLERPRDQPPRSESVRAPFLGRDDALVGTAADAVGDPLRERVRIRWCPPAVDLEPRVGIADGISRGSRGRFPEWAMTAPTVATRPVRRECHGREHEQARHRVEISRLAIGHCDRVRACDLVVDGCHGSRLRLDVDGHRHECPMTTRPLCRVDPGVGTRKRGGDHHDSH